MEKDEQRFLIKYLWMKRWGTKRIHEELLTTFGVDPYGPPQIKIWLERFKTGDLSGQDLPRAGRPLLTIGPQLKAFLEKYPFSSSRVIAQHFLVTIPTLKEILQRELGMRQFSRQSVPHFLSEDQKIARVEAATEMLAILQSCEADGFCGIATGDESWLRCLYPSAEMFARFPADVVPGTRQTIKAKKTMVTLFCTARETDCSGNPANREEIQSAVSY
jgi:hypothetical protein